MRILLLCRSLGIGGTERQIVVLAKGLRQRVHDVGVLVFYGQGELENELREHGIPVLDVRKTGRWDTLPFFVRCARAVRTFRPTVLYGFLAAPNILGLLLKILLPRTPIVWGVRASNVDLSQYDWLSRLAYRMECGASRLADLIICNSHAGLEYAAMRGFPRQKMMTIPNGIDVERFRPDAALRAVVREEWSIDRGETLIGLVGRIDPMKDHPTFFRAAALLAEQRPDVRFTCVGDGAEPYRSELRRLATRLGLDRKLIWVGDRSDIPAVYNALDICVSASCTEGFSNTIAESMACGVPCVVTDVGDSALIVGQVGEIVPPRSPVALAEGLHRMMQRLDMNLAQAARESIVRRFSIEALVSHTVEALSCVSRATDEDCR